MCVDWAVVAVCICPAVYGEIEFECGHWGVFENAIDMAHIHYLHADSFGNRCEFKAGDDLISTGLMRLENTAA
jgi:hypothetical protein